MTDHLRLRLRFIFWTLAVLHGASPALLAQVDVDRVLSRILEEWRNGSTPSPPGAMDRLANLGTDAAPAVPRLIAALRDSEPACRAQAARTLMNLGPAAQPAVPALIALVRDPDPNVRQAATFALANLGRMAEPAIPTLVEALRADPGPRRMELVWALTALGDPARPALIELLKEPEPAIRKAVLQRLTQVPWTTQFGRPTRIAKQLEPRLETLANDPDPAVRIALANFLFVCPSDSEAAIALFQTLSRDSNSGVRIALVRALGRTGTIPAPLRPGYLKLLEDKDPDVRVEAATWVPYHELGARAFIEVLLNMLKDPSARIRAGAARKLTQAHFTQQFWNPEGGLGFQTRTSVVLARSLTAFAVLKSAVSDSDPVVRAAAMGLLPVWKGESATVIPLLIDRLKDPDASVRSQAASGLVPFGPAAKGATRALLASLADPGAAEPAAMQIAIASVRALEAIGGPANDKMLLMMMAQLNSLDASVRNRARVAMQNLGKKVDRTLIPRFADPRTTRHVQIELMTVLFGQVMQQPRPDLSVMVPVLRSLARDDDLQVRQTAIRLLTHIDPRAPEAVAMYFAGLRDGQDPQQINRWLSSVINPEMIPQLIVGLCDDNPEIRVETAHWLAFEAEQLAQQHRQNRAGGLPPSAAQIAARERQKPLIVQTIQALIAALKDPDGRVRWIATFAPGVLESEADTVVPILIEMVKHETARVPSGNQISFRPFADRGQYYFLGPSRKDVDPLRIAAMQALGSFGPAAAPAVPVLIDALHDPDPRIRWFAIESLALIGPAAKAAVPALIEALHSPVVAAAGLLRGNGMFMFNEMDDGPIRLIAAEALGRIGPDAKAAIPDLIAALSGPDSRVRAEAARALGGIGPEAARAIPELVRILTRGHPAMAVQWTQYALVEFGAASVPALLEVLRNNDPDVRNAAIETLGKLETKAASALPKLIVGLHDPITRIRVAAAQAVGEVGPESGAAIAALVDTLKDLDDDVAGAAFHALAKLGKPALPSVLALTRDDDPATRNMAVSLLSLMARPVPVWGNRSRADVSDRSPAIRALLRSALGDRDERIRSGASAALQKLDESVVPDLIAALDDPSPTIRSGAARTLGALGDMARQAIGPLRRHQNEPDSEVHRAVDLAILAIEQSKLFDVVTMPKDP